MSVDVTPVLGRCRMHQRDDCDECFDWKAEVERLREALGEFVAAVEEDITAGYDESERTIRARGRAKDLIYA